MKKLLSILLIVYSSSFIAVNAQKEIKRTWHWYFGDKAGLDFSSGTAIKDTTGQMNVWLGCISISDTNGKLLFYSDGHKVWNRNHIVMPHGMNLYKYGGIEASQLLVAPMPGNDSLYYLFSIDYIQDTIPPFGSKWIYAVVNMAKDGGLGDVVSQYNLLMNNPSQKITATKHANGKDIWIITMLDNTNSYYAYLLTSSGIDTTNPVVSSIGKRDTVGSEEMKVSFDGKKIATALSSNNVEILDFSNSTGLVSNPMTFPQLPNIVGGKACEAYGIEFSPDGQKLYVSYYWTWPDSSANTIYQIHIMPGNPIGTIASSVLLDTTSLVFSAHNSYNYGFTYSLQLGSDGKIYEQKEGLYHLGAIINPDVLGIGCGNVDSLINLNRLCNAGFPGYVRNYFYMDSLYTGLPNEDMICTDNLKVYPNPNQGKFILVNGCIKNEAKNKVEVFNILGEKIYLNDNVRFSPDNYSIYIDLCNQITGVYLYRVTGENGNVIGTGKFIIQ
ncbi:MAG TPA: T9SS type A sorting domain-containing protein [Bacteroidia bacterium]|nr:T9SS type A sorting domain-containing protein [Bacteroidia bacterium]